MCFHFHPSTDTSFPIPVDHRPPIHHISLSPDSTQQGRGSGLPLLSTIPLTDGLENLSYSKGFIETFFFHIQVGAKRKGLINRNLKGKPRA